MGFNTEAISYPSSNGVDLVFAKLYIPTDTDLRAVVQICHGMCEHIDRYADFARFLCERGIMVCGNDHIGHRHSVKSPSGLGFFAPQDGWKYLIRDAYELTLLVRERYPATPYFLLGHSMGSFVARCYMGRHGARLSGAIISGTGGPNPLMRTAEQLAGALCRTQGMHGRSKLLEHLVSGNWNDRFEHRTPKDWISRDTAAVDAYIADPHTSFRFTNAGYRDLFTLSGLANNSAWADAVPKALPVLFVSGDQDPVGDYGRGVRKVVRMLEDAGLSDITLRLYRGGRHEMLNEVNRAQVYEDIYTWLAERTAL